MDTSTAPLGPPTADLFRRWNALAQKPGDLDLIREYVDRARDQIGATEDAVEKVTQTDALLAFLSHQSAHVAPEDVDALASLADEILASGQDAPDNSAAEADLPPDERLQSFLSSPPSEVPASVEDIRERLVESDQARDYADERGEAFPPEAEAYVGRLQAALQHEAALAEGTALLNLAQQEADASASAYLLQACEGIVRQVVLMETQVGPDRTAQGRALLADLKEASEHIRNQSMREDSEAVWASFEKEHGSQVRLAQKWTRPGKSAMDGACTHQIDKVRDLMRAAQRILPQLTDAQVQGRATELMEELGECLEAASTAQQRRYNLHAMASIQKCYKAGQKHSGFIDNEQKIGRALIDNLGPLDLRHLTSEVQRCYSEVFEYLYGRLDRPGKADDFESNTNKLYVLKEMSEAKTTSIENA